jgi:superfamily I DNA and/or RNA helicase
VSALEYDGKLVTAARRQDAKPPKFPWPVPNLPVMFVETEGKEVASGTSYTNVQEVTVVLQCVRYLVRFSGVDPVDIAVITPYNAQCEKIESQLKRLALSSVPAVNSVDGFQVSACLLCLVCYELIGL